jgi:hypothetical protein
MNNYAADALSRAGGDAPPMIAYTKLYDNAGGNDLIYEGWAKSSLAPSPANPVWAIRKYTYTSGVMTSVTYSQAGVECCVWNNRASLTYV